MQKANTKKIATLAILSSLSIVLYMFVKFPIPVLFPAFLDIQISDAPIIFASLIYGLSGGAAVALVRFLLKLPFTSTAGVGEIADLLITLAFIVPLWLINKKARTGKKSLWLGLSLGSVVATTVAVVANYLLLIPFYVEFYFGGDFSVLIAMVSPLYDGVTVGNFYTYYIFLAVIPFNILRLGGVVAVSYFSYTKLKEPLSI